jgi:hypothetical protein
LEQPVRLPLRPGHRCEPGWLDQANLVPTPFAIDYLPPRCAMRPAPHRPSGLMASTDRQPKLVRGSLVASIVLTFLAGMEVDPT